MDTSGNLIEYPIHNYGVGTIPLYLSFIPLIIEQGKNLSLLNNSELKSNIESIIVNVNEYFEANSLSVYDFLSEITLLSDIDFAFIPNLLNYIISELGSIGIGLLSIFIWLSTLLNKS